MNDKKDYTTPMLTVHGDVQTITQNAYCDDADTDEGVPDTAFTVGGGCSS